MNVKVALRTEPPPPPLTVISRSKAVEFGCPFNVSEVPFFANIIGRFDPVFTSTQTDGATPAGNAKLSLSAATAIGEYPVDNCVAATCPPPECAVTRGLTARPPPLAPVAPVGPVAPAGPVGPVAPPPARFAILCVVVCAAPCPLGVIGTISSPVRETRLIAPGTAGLVTYMVSFCRSWASSSSPAFVRMASI